MTALRNVGVGESFGHWRRDSTPESKSLRGGRLCTALQTIFLRLYSATSDCESWQILRFEKTSFSSLIALYRMKRPIRSTRGETSEDLLLKAIAPERSRWGF
jgi:hypothetical protein